jgi:cellulose synthase (UDP-forming)
MTPEPSRPAPRPQRRQHEPGPLREFGSWLWHLLVLPRDEARPWPAWVRRLAARLGVGDPDGLGAWLRALLLRDPPAPASPWSGSADRRLPPHRQPADVLDLLADLARPHTDRLRARAAHALAGYAARVGSGWARADGTLQALAVVLVALVVVVVATTPLDLVQQFVAALVLLGASLLVRAVPAPEAGLVLMAISLLASARYIWWRLTSTLALNPGIELVLGLGLLGAEAYTWTILLLGYLQNSRPLGRPPASLPPDRATWPTVDVLIPTLNEPLAVVAPTILAALALDWPADKLRVHVLDDGARPEFRRFALAAGARYLAREGHANAKAGNLNHALRATSGEYVAVFDCDHIPVRSFLTETAGWLVREPRCALVQTPHHFFSPDPFERNLGTFRRVPSEGDLFYGLVQDGNDLWNATFFCGSCAVLRRSALEEVGLIAEQSVTEDALTALRLHRRGYTTAYVREVLAGGLAAETLAGHIRQRVRWARGMAQIFRLDNPLAGPGLSLLQRLCYANAMLHFFACLPRLVFLTAPLAYLFFEFHVINAAAITLASYALPHLVQAAVANSHLQRRFRHSVWNEAYEAALSWYTAMPTLLALLAPASARFNVTAKGGTLAVDHFDWRIALPYVVLALLNLAGVALAVPRLLFWNTYEADTVLINAVWTLFNLTLLGAVLGVAAESAQRRSAQRMPKSLPARLLLADGRELPCRTSDFSTTGIALEPDGGATVPRGENVLVGLRHEGGEAHFAAVVLGGADGVLRLRLRPLSIAALSTYVQCTFARPDAWRDWSQAMSPDRPLRSLGEVLSFGASGYGRAAAMVGAGAVRALRRGFGGRGATAGAGQLGA